VAEAEGRTGGVRQWRGPCRLTGWWINGGDSSGFRVRVLGCWGGAATVTSLE
jgi:hypothetical protein